MKLKLFIAAIIASSVSLHAAQAQASAKFTFEDLKAMAKASAKKPYTPVEVPAPELIDKITYDEHWKIRFKEDETLYPNGEKAPVQLFYPGRYFPEPVSIFIRDDKNNVKELPFSNALFDMPDDSPAHDLPEGFGFAGFRIMRPDIKPDWISFLGASYFRTDGPQGQYGLSARGIAINTGMSEPEEFPRFSAFWLGPAENKGESMSVWALLEGPSVTGAYRFGLSKEFSVGPRSKILIAADAVHPNNNPEYINAGVEFNLWDLIFLRAGQSHLLYKQSSFMIEEEEITIDPLHGVSIGFGLNYQIPRGPKIRIDYVQTDFGIFNSVSGYSINFSF